MNHKIVIATSNPGKFYEIEAGLQKLEIPLLSLKEFSHVAEAPEEGNEFDEIARNKANYYYEQIQLPVLAEDSGLVVPALQGFPGIHSARIASSDGERIRIVMQRLQGLQNRGAFYHCSMVFQTADQRIEVQGRCDGIIVDSPRGLLGFGYDPIFRPQDSDRTFGEMDWKEKANYSHRGSALKEILPQIRMWIRHHP